MNELYKKLRHMWRTGWLYYYRNHLGWMPFQSCEACGRWYWGGLPLGGWRAVFMSYCSKKCHDEGEW